MRRRAAPVAGCSLAGLVLGACFPSVEIDPNELPANVSIEGYEQWSSFEVDGPAPGHGETQRILFRNDVARAYAHGGFYPDGTVIVKEIRDPVTDDELGDLRYLAIMRRIDDPPDGVPTDEGWLFTDLRDGSEVQKELCWASCHRQAPYQGAFFDHGF